MVAPATIAAAAAAWLLPVNLCAFLCVGADKARARQGRWRIAERRLLGLALIGGTAGLFLGRHVFRHKTRKQPFTLQLHLIAVIQIGAVIGWLII